MTPATAGARVGPNAQARRGQARGLSNVGVLEARGAQASSLSEISDLIKIKGRVPPLANNRGIWSEGER